MTRKFFFAAFAVLMTATGAFAQAVQRYEAEAATLSGGAAVVQLTGVSGGSYVKAEGGNISFSISAPSAGHYTIWAQYSMTYGEPGGIKKQNIFINNVSQGEATFERTRTGPEGSPTASEFKSIKIAGKVTLKAGANTFDIRNSWGWVDIDYIEVGPFTPEPFILDSELVTAKRGVTPSVNARKMYQFMRENFQKKIISGVMTGYSVNANSTFKTEAEVKHIYDASGKYPALLGLDFMHGTGYAAPSEKLYCEWYNDGVLAMAEQIFNDGGIPHLMWHWKNPLKVLGQGENKDNQFYAHTSLSASGKSDGTRFNLSNAFTNSQHTAWNINSDEYKGIMADIDAVSGYLKSLADKGVPVLWRPLHEAAGTWFWWGAAGGTTTTAMQKAQANKMLWILMFERMVDHHKLNNLIWVWTCEENSPLAWYPGDEYADIIGRDYYSWGYDPVFQTDQADGKFVPGSLVLNFESLKEIYSAKKIIGLSEQGTVPHPDSLVADGAGWSFFMTWNTSFVTNGKANPNTHWNAVMNHSYVLTLDKMPGWSNYQLTTSISRSAHSAVSPRSMTSVRSRRGAIELSVTGADVQTVELFNLRGVKIAVLNSGNLSAGAHRFTTKGIAKQMAFVRIKTVDNHAVTLPVKIE